MIAAIIEWSARHRWLVLTGVAAALLAAAVCVRQVKLDALPDLSEPQVIVFTEWTGRSPTLMEDQVTYPIAAKLVGTPHVSAVRGFSMFGMSFVHVIFDEGTDIYWGRSRVLEYLEGLRGALPEGVAPALGPDATGIGWIVHYALVDHAGTHSLTDLRTFQDYTLKPALGSVRGVAEVASIGGLQKQYQVTVNEERLRAFGIGITEVMDAIRASNGEVGGRILEMAGREYYVRARGYIQDPDAIARIGLRSSGPGGAALHVGDVATVRLGGELRRGLLDWNGQGEAVGGVIVMRQGENAREVIDRVKAHLSELRPSLPPGVEVVLAYDRSSLIDRAVATLLRALVEEGLTVSAVIVIFLLHLRSSLLPILSLPISVALSFIPMVVFGIPSTIMSLGGIAIAIGATVDAEIVMIEASHKKLEHAGPGADRQALLAEAAKEVTPAIFFSLLIIAVAFLPVFTLTGQAGRLFKPLAYTKTFVMLISALLSITFAPALRDLLIRGRIYPERRHPVSRLLIRIYEPFVYVALRRPWSTVAIGLLALASAVPLAWRLGHEFMPPLNEGDLLYMPITLPNISADQARQQLIVQDRLLKRFPEVESVFGKVGRVESATDPAPLSMVETTVRLRPPSLWRTRHHDRWYSHRAPAWAKPVLRRFWPEDTRLTWDELVAEMDATLRMPGWTNAWTMPIKTRVDMLTTGVRTPVGIKVFGTTLESVEAAGVALEGLVRAVPGTRSVVHERTTGGLYIDIIPKPEELARYGLHLAQLQYVVESAIGGTPLTTTIEGRARFTVAVRTSADSRRDPEALRRIAVQGGPATVTLGQVADVQIATGPPMIRSEGGLLVGYVYVDLEPARDLGGFVEDAKATVARALADGRLRLPGGTFIKWTGQYEQLTEVVARMKIVVPLTLALIVVLLYWQFRDVVEVLIVLLSIPFALVGSVWLLWLLDYRLSTAVWVGIIALIGLATQTGVVMILYIDQAYRRRKDAGQIYSFDDIIAAHREGVVMRVRPKVMTVATMLIGLVPLLWARSSGADVMKRIAAPMIGGLLTSAFLTLEIIPVIVTVWRSEQLLWANLPTTAHKRLSRTITPTALGGAVLFAAGALPVYLQLPRWVPLAMAAAGALSALAGVAAYLAARRRWKTSVPAVAALFAHHRSPQP